MLLLNTLAAAALAAGLGGAPAAAAVTVRADSGPVVRVEVDSSKHVVRVIAGPYDLENMPPMDDAMMDHGMGMNTPVSHFAWPVQGWMRGFEWRLRDASGTPVPRDVMHHMIMVNMSRRQLLYSAAERLLGAGSETDDVSVPKTIGVPLTPGSDLGFYIMWHNSTGHDLKGVYLEIDMLWTPTTQVPRPLNSLPIYMDVNLTVGGSNEFDVPPGHSEKSWTFTMPIDGRLLGVGGHVHDYGSWVKLQDAESGKELARVVARRTPEGKVLSVSRKLFGVSGQGLKMKAGHRYRVTGAYDNPTGHTLINGAMAHMVGLFVPDDMSQWPKLDPSDTTFQKDLAALNSMGQDDGMHMEGMDHQHMQHEKMDHEKMDHEHMQHMQMQHDSAGHGAKGHEGMQHEGMQHGEHGGHAAHGAADAKP